MLLRAFAHARTLIAIGGVAFAAIELVSACLDHFDEQYGQCAPQTAGDGGADCGAAQTGSGSGAGQ